MLIKRGFSHILKINVALAINDTNLLYQLKLTAMDTFP
jgi:hypothetical protein